IMPLPFAGGRVQREHAVPEQITSLAKRAVKILRGRSGGAENPSSLLVDGQPAPRIGAAVVLSFNPFPRVVPILTGLGYRMEDPFELTGHRIISADMPGRRVIAFVYARAH